MNKSNLTPSPTKGTRFAVMDDFRQDGQLTLDIQYWEYMFGSWTWELRWTETETDRENLNTKIFQNYILVNDPPMIYNQKSISEIIKLLEDAA